MKYSPLITTVAMQKTSKKESYLHRCIQVLNKVSKISPYICLNKLKKVTKYFPSLKTLSITDKVHITMPLLYLKVLHQSKVLKSTIHFEISGCTPYAIMPLGYMIFNISTVRLYIISLSTHFI